jgi:hypothetical protein
LPLRLAPVEGESLPGYVARYSHTFRFPPGDVIRALGLDGGSGIVLDARRYGAWLTQRQLEHVALATGMDPATLERMLLSRFAGRAFEEPTGSSPDMALAAAAQAHEVLIRCSRFCPDCLRESGAWLLGWQLGWSCVCLSHRLLLVRRCPSCGTVPKSTLRDRWPGDRTGILSDPTRCAHRLQRRLCRTPFAIVDTPTVGAAALAAQRRINALLDGQLEPTLAGVQLEPPIYLRDLLTLCNLLHRHARPSTHGTLTTRLGRRLHDHPQELASVLPDALALADLPDPDALAEALRELADQRYRADGLTLLATKSGPMSAQLHSVLRRAVSQTVWASASRQLGFHPSSHRRPDDLDHGLQARHVPQLFWADDYDRELAELFDFDDFTHWLGRRFCSVLLTRMLTPLDWEGAVRYLDFPEHKRFINDGYNTTFAKLRTHGRFDELARRVKRIANEHAACRLVDYKHRRVELSGWQGIEVDSWHLLQPRPRPLYPHRRVDMPVRRAQASIWIWSELTSGDERAAPLQLPTTRGLFDQTNFIRTLLPAFRDRLLILSELLIATPAHARSTLHNRLAAALRQRRYLAENFYLDTIDPLITSRVLAHTSAHTGVDIPSLSAPSIGSHAAPAVTHARLLTARLLRRTALASWRSAAVIIGGDANHISDNDRRYQSALDQDPRLAAELEHLVALIENWRTPQPTPPSTPHAERMRELAIAIKARADALLAASHGPYVAQRTSIALCRHHTDLTCPTIAAVHAVKDAQPSFSHATVARHRRTDRDFDRRYQQLNNYARELRRQAGYASANLQRGLTTRGTRTPRRPPPRRPSIPNQPSHSKLA